MPTNTYVAIDTKTITSAVANVTFTSIPQTYTDLVLVVNGGLTTNGQSFRFQVGNGTIDTGNNYSYSYFAGNGSTASATRVLNTSGFNAYHVAGQSDSAIKNNVIVNFQNYSNTLINKTILNRGNSDLEAAGTVALWRSTSAINTILVGTTSGNLAVGTTISLYGIAKAAAFTTKATGGTIVQAADGYVYHTFTGSGTFTPNQTLTCDYLVVAGGGGGGYQQGGGGGAGGFATGTSSLTATAYTITVGGPGSASGGGSGGNGTNSSLASVLVATGGGGGGGRSGNNAGNGGSGGGGGLDSNAGTGTSGQGFAGGASNGLSGAGGGGASAAGLVAPNGDNGGIGGNGSIWLNGSTYAGGGGGGTFSGSVGQVQANGGTGGGGGGGRGSSSGAAGTTNTGGGGGGGGQYSGNLYNGSAGGSGIVIIRYLG